jgi:hypothetical protein
MKCTNATKVNRKSGGAKWRDLRFTIRTLRIPMEALPYPLSSRPKRSVVEGSAVPRTCRGNVFFTSAPLTKQSEKIVEASAKFTPHNWNKF